MPLKIAEHQTERYQINTEVYNGPLDLLLDLIEHAQLDITTLALAQVTDQYLDYLHHLQVQDLSEVSAFLVIAARLVQIKSNALLPRPSIMDSNVKEEDDGEALARQLIIYRRFKQLSIWLENRHSAGLRSYLRLTAPTFKIKSKLDLEGLGLLDFIKIAQHILISPNSLPGLTQEMITVRISIRDKIHSILGILKESGPTSFQALLHNSSRLEIVVTFLALLELIKINTVQVEQSGLFGDIILQSLHEWDDKSEEQLEFQD